MEYKNIPPQDDEKSESVMPPVITDVVDAVGDVINGID